MQTQEGAKMRQTIKGYKKEPTKQKEGKKAKKRNIKKRKTKKEMHKERYTQIRKSEAIQYANK